MQYRNVTNEPVLVATAFGFVSVAPGNTVLTAPRNARELVNSGTLVEETPTPGPISLPPENNY